jgi:hypothetical protein
MDGGLRAAVRINPLLYLRTDEILSNRWGPPHHALSIREALPFSRRSVWMNLPDSRWGVESRALILIAYNLRRPLVLIVAVIGGCAMEHLSLLEPFSMIELGDVFVARALHGLTILPPVCSAIPPATSRDRIAAGAMLPRCM